MNSTTCGNKRFLERKEKHEGTVCTDNVAKKIHQSSADIERQKEAESLPLTKKPRADNDDIIDLTGESEDNLKIEVGSRIRIWWRYERQYFSGTVDMIKDEGPDPHHILYDDGVEEWTNLFKRNFEPIGTRARSCDVSTASGNDDFSMASIEELSGCDSDFVKRSTVSAINTMAHRKLSLETLHSHPASNTGAQATIETIDLCSEESPDAQKGDSTSRLTATDHKYTANNFQEDEWKDTCSLCNNEAKRPRATSCHHIFCRICIITSEAVGVCPVCNAAVASKLQRYKPDHKSFKAVEALLETTAEVVAQYKSASAASLQSKNGLSASRIIDACCSLRRDGSTYQGYYWRFVG